MIHLRQIRLALFAICAVPLSACGPKEPAPTRIIGARQLLTVEDCKGYYSAAFQRGGEQFMGHNPLTSEREHVTLLDFEGES